MFKHGFGIFHATTTTLLLLFITQNDGFVNSPKIITKDGNLIVESGLNRNISFILNGKSRLTINDEYDVMDLLLMQGTGNRSSSRRPSEWEEEENALSRTKMQTEMAVVKNIVFGPMGLTKVINRLQTQTRNATALLRRSQMRLNALETRLQNLQTKLQEDMCSSSPCENGGSCLNIFNGTVCKCPKNFEGTNCEKDVNECALYDGTDLGCQNNGQCVNQFGSYQCICTPGWYGIHCNQRKGNCMEASSWELCGHGICVNSNDEFGYKCICDQGWRTNGLTPTCMTDVDECAESRTPCSTKCINLPGSFSCAPCAAGLTGNGINCRDIDECAVDNGGCSKNPFVHCINTYGSFLCGECPLGWSGDGRTCTRTASNDSTDTTATCAGNNICHPDAACSVISNTVVCTCKTGMIGSGIGVNGCVPGKAANCNALPCLNGGTCLDGETSGYTCLCPAGFKEPNCEPLKNACEQSNPCQNGATCVSTLGAVHCQCAPGYTGRLCDRSISQCGGILHGSSGRLKYPEGSLYNHNSQCAWVIRTSETKVLNVTFNSFVLEDSPECRFDWLQINDGRNAAAHILGRFCGSHKPFGGNIISTTNMLYLWFRSDNSSAREGFDLEWSSIDPICGGVIEVSSHGTIATPGSPGNYPKNRDCTWLLRAPNTKRLKFTFFRMEIENHDSCNFDYVEIKDAVSETLLEKFCNSSSPAPLLLPTNEVTVVFHSDDEGSDSGFQIYYSLEERIPGCGGTFTAKEGTIQSPASFQNSISCEYDIKMAISESIRLDFRKFEMGPNDCIEIYDINADKDIRMLQSKVCGGLDTMPQSIYSTYNALQLKYYSSGGHFELDYKADCSYMFDSAQGEVLSPNYPRIPAANTLCTYKIVTEPQTVISVEVEDFQLRDSATGDDEDCTRTFLTVNDGLDREILGPFCGNATPSSFVSKTNHLTMNLQTDVTSLGRGFKVKYVATPMSSTQCGGVLTREGQKIRSPGFGGNGYGVDLECLWIIMAPPNKGIMLNWLSFDLEKSTECSYDYVEIYDKMPSGSADHSSYGRYCENPPSLVMHSRIMVVKFSSDFSDSGEGFEASFQFVDYMQDCGGNILASNGRITSPGWPLNYTNNMDCVWVITTPPGNQLELRIDVFELEASENCINDFLEVRNGGSDLSPLVGVYCNRFIPKTIPSFTHQMRIRFRSDGFTNARGFRISWILLSNACGGILSAAEGALASPLYPNNYPNIATCDWQIRVPKGSSIHFHIDDMELEEWGQCNYDYVEAFNGIKAHEWNMIFKLCRIRNDIPSDYFSEGNEALVRFISDFSSSERGFLMSYKLNCSRTLRDLYGIIESPNFYTPFDQRQQNCSWTIQAPKGNTVALEWSHFETYGESSPFLISDTLRNGSTIVHTVSAGISFNSSGSTVTIQQNSSSTRFRLEYAVMGCVAMFHRDEGKFNTPNFPKAYDNNLECMWQIQVEHGKAIEITIEDMDIEMSPNCTKDALEISPHYNSHNAKDRFCGKRSALIMTFASHQLFVRFQSDGQSNGKGFKASYKVVPLECGGLYQVHQGSITSPNYPMDYPRNSNCEWSIEVAEFHTIAFTIEELDIEYSPVDGCTLDFVEAYQTLNGTDDQIFKLCDDVDENAKTWKTVSNKATVRFVTDDSVEHKGFKLNFRESCGQRIGVTSEYGFFDYSDGGHTNETCEWQFESKDLSKHVMLSITKVTPSQLTQMSHTTEEDCAENGIKIFDGDSSRSPLRSKFCMVHPATLFSNGHVLTLRVPQNLISELQASYQLMDNTCGEFFDSLSGKFASPLYPDSYTVNIECVWIISGSSGNSLVLTIESMDMEESEDCNKDYLEVRETSSKGKLLGFFCGNNIPASMEGYQNLWVKFRSDDDVVGKGFLASYSYAHHTELTGMQGLIESPLYSQALHWTEPYSYRITVNKTEVIHLTISYLTDSVVPGLKIYNGYADIAAELDYTPNHSVHSSTNIVFIRATRAPFAINWQAVSKEDVHSNETLAEMVEKCGQSTITVGSSLLRFTSPGYPQGYESGLNCSWQFVSQDPASHVVVSLTHIDLEDFNECGADFVTVSSSADLNMWQELDRLCKKSQTEVTKQYHGTPNLRINFVTDMSVNKTGFAAFVKLKCGSTLTEPRGFVNITKLAANSEFQAECVWFIRVRSTKRIRIRFPDSIFNLNNETALITNCRNNLIVRNGIGEDSPFLGKGKYCDNNIVDVLETSSNKAYVKFVRVGMSRFSVSFQYEEIAHECSDDIVLSEDTQWDRVKTITSPKYPNIPNPHTECIWRITAPYHHVINVNFEGRFDLLEGTGPVKESCDKEYVELSDGTSQFWMVRNDRFCGTKKPNSWTSTGNVMRIKYYSDVGEPHVGFKLNVSIGLCGGSYFEDEGSFSQPSVVAGSMWQGVTECAYVIHTEEGSTIRLNIEDLQLPYSANCSQVSHLRLDEIFSTGLDDVENTTDSLTVCGNQPKYYLVETNKVIIRYRFKGSQKPSPKDKFKITYKAIGSRCGETISATEGILTTPGYPNVVTRPMHCVWRLEVPKGLRIKLEFLDYDNGGSGAANVSWYFSGNFRGRISVANDFKSRSIIARFVNNPPNLLYSTDNRMLIDAFVLPLSHRGFKLRYTSTDEKPYCRHPFAVNSPLLTFKGENETAVYCRYDLQPAENTTLVLSVEKFELFAELSPLPLRSLCVFFSPVQLILQDDEILMADLICRNETKPTARLPFAATLNLSANRRNKLKELQLRQTTYACGGTIYFNSWDELVIRQPAMEPHQVGQRLECAWAVWSDEDRSAWLDDYQLQLTLASDLNGSCEDNYLLIYNGPNQNSPHLGRYCNQATIDNVVVEHGLFFEYYTSSYDTKSSFNLTLKQGSGCGGKLKYPYRKIFFSDQYKNNVECVWELETDIGYHLAVVFEDRFFIESSPDCRKDYLKIQQIDENGTDWMDVFTLCGRTAPTAVNTTTNRMRLIFRSDGENVGDGFTAKFERNCGGLLYADEELRSLSSPGYPVRYMNDMYCKYTIQRRKSSNPGVLVRFVDFELEQPPDRVCLFDNVTVAIDTYLTDPKKTVLCGRNKNFEFRATEFVTVALYTDSSFNAKGFKLEYTTQVCGGLITNSTRIKSPREHSTGNVPANMNCFWNLTAPEGHKIIIKFEEIDYESNWECQYDNVEVFEGYVEVTDQRMARFCGNITKDLPTVQITSNRGLIHTTTDTSDSSRGFTALVSFVPNCDRVIMLTDTNSTYELSISGPDGTYAHNSDCAYVLKTSKDRRLSLEFSSFHVDETDGCTDDYMEVRDGSGPFADLMGRFCGHTIPAKLTSSGNTLHIHFVSDSQGGSSGVRASVKAQPALCGARHFDLSVNNTVVWRMPDSDGNANYPPNVNCLWSISSDKTIHLKFNKFDLGPSTLNASCGTDQLKIYNREDADNVKKGYGSHLIFNGHMTPSSPFNYLATDYVYCGNSTPDDYFSTSKEIYVQFRSGPGVGHKGFSVTATRVNGCFRNFTGTQGRISISETENVCDIYIQAPENYTLSVYYDDLLFMNYDCEKEHLEVFDAHTNATLQKFCGGLDASKSLFSQTNQLRLHLLMSSYYTQYDMTWLATKDGAGCGGDLYNTQGILTSPHYPESVRNNMECRWNIRVPSNLHVLVRFPEFNMGVKSTCHTDYLQILEVADDGSEQEMRRFCGGDTPKMYRSSRPFIAVRYHKTMNFAGTGWVLKFRGVHQNYQSNEWGT